MNEHQDDDGELVTFKSGLEIISRRPDWYVVGVDMALAGVVPEEWYAFVEGMSNSDDKEGAFDTLLAENPGIVKDCVVIAECIMVRYWIDPVVVRDKTTDEQAESDDGPDVAGIRDVSIEDKLEYLAWAMAHGQTGTEVFLWNNDVQA